MSPHTRILPLLAALGVALLAPPGARPAAPPRPRTDLYGDPLPEGAVARLGSIQLRHPGLSDFVFLDGGTVLEQGPPEQVLNEPREEQTKQFLRRFLDGR